MYNGYTRPLSMLDIARNIAARLRQVAPNAREIVTDLLRRHDEIGDFVRELDRVTREKESAAMQGQAAK